MSENEAGKDIHDDDRTGQPCTSRTDVEATTVRSNESQFDIYPLLLSCPPEIYT
jgi:hypothetical protein